MNKCLTILLLLPAAAIAQVTYDYTGQPMSGTETGNPYPYSPPISFCCAALDGTITLASPLAPNLVNAPVTPQSATFSFFGVVAGGTLYPQNPTLQFGPNGSAVSVLFANTMDFSTNAAGKITAWDVALSIPLNLGGTPNSWSVTSISAGDSGTYDTSGYNITEPNDYTVSDDVGGKWAAAPEMNAGPALAALTLLLGGVAVFRGQRQT